MAEDNKDKNKGNISMPNNTQGDNIRKGGEASQGDMGTTGISNAGQIGNQGRGIDQNINRDPNTLNRDQNIRKGGEDKDKKNQ